MESLQPDDQEWIHPLEFVEPSSYAVQAFKLLEIQHRHQQELYAHGIAAIAYEELGSERQKKIENTPPQFRRYVVYRRLHPKHSLAAKNTEFGIMFFHRDQLELENGFKSLPMHVAIGEIVDGSVNAIDKNNDKFSDDDRLTVYEMMQEILTAEANGELPDIKFDLSAIVDKTDATDKPTPLI